MYVKGPNRHVQRTIFSKASSVLTLFLLFETFLKRQKTLFSTWSRREIFTSFMRKRFTSCPISHTQVSQYFWWNKRLNTRYISILLSRLNTFSCEYFSILMY